jgi:UDP-glucose 4-epimerase
VTGGAGFIGSSLCEALVSKGWDITIVDNFSSGSKTNLEPLTANHRLSPMVLSSDLCSGPHHVEKAAQDCDIVFHFAANPEVRMELNDPEQCFQQNVYATYNVLEAFRKTKADTFVFASTSTVYGEARTLPTPEGYAPLEPISLYGASKLAGEALVSSYCRTFNRHGIILRLANVVGPRSKHGVVVDFAFRLAQRPDELAVLGDGKQNKSYIHIDDCVQGILAASDQRGGPLEVFNIGSEDSITVREIGLTIARTMGLSDPRMKFNGGLVDGRGWIGDVRTMLLDTKRLKSIGWSPKLTSREAIEQTIKELMPRLTMNSGVF